MPPISGGILIKREQLARQRRAEDIYHQARRQAVKLIKQAEVEAEQLRRQARSDGFQQGVLASASVVATFLAERQAQSQSLQYQVDDHARALLTHALTHADLPLRLLEEWLAEQVRLPPAEMLTLLVPETIGTTIAQMKRQLGALWPGKYEILRHPGNSFKMKYGTQVAEFDAGEFIDATVRQLTSAPDYDGETRRLSEEALQQLAALFSGYFAGQPVLFTKEIEYD